MEGQKQRILDYMNRHGGITAKQASDDIGVSRLASRIGELKDLGYPITYEWESGFNRYGDKTRWKKYMLVKRPAKAV